MAGEQSAQDGDATMTVGEPSEASGPRGTPEESSAGLAPPKTPALDSSESDAPPLRPGETLVGRFTVVRFIAHGGMGAVYEATDRVLRTRVALKLIVRRIAQDSTAIERLRREVLLARRVSHPNVCRVHELYEATTASGEPIQFLTMELLSGETLARKLAREGTLSSAQALALVQQMCAGLAAAHSEGVVHRDFKSSNVMLVPRTDVSGESTGRMRVAITDFGWGRSSWQRECRPAELAWCGSSERRRRRSTFASRGWPERHSTETVRASASSRSGIRAPRQALPA